MFKKCVVTMILSLFCMVTVHAAQTLTGGQLPAKPAKLDRGIPGINFATVPLYFIANKGQVNKSASFYAKTSCYTLWVTKQGLVFDSLKAVKKDQFKRDVTRMNFLGSNPNPVIVPLEQSRHRVNYFRGKDSSKWHTDIPTSGVVMYKNVYDGIDLKVYGVEGEVEYDWIVEPGANPAAIRFQYRNVRGTSIDAGGNLVIDTKFGRLSHKKPFSYQVVDGKQVPVTVSFKKIKENVYGFHTGDYDPGKPLVIDPVVLVYSTYFGGTGAYEYVKAFTTDYAGKVYFTGATTSTDFPTQDAYDSTYNNLYGHYDCYVSVVDTTQSGSAGLEYSTYMGADGVDQGHGIAIDSNGVIYVCGTSWDTTTNGYFPVTDSTQPQGGYDLFAAKLDPSLTGTSQLLMSTLRGGKFDEVAKAITFDSSGNIYLAGYTQSSQTVSPYFPLTSNAYQTSKVGTYDYFIMKLSSSGGILYSSYFGGGTSGDEDYSDVQYIGLDTDNYLYVVGEARANDFPIKGTPLKSTRQNFDGFISIFDLTQSTGSNTLLYSSFFGGTAYDEISGIFMDGDDAYITGRTQSSPGSGGFPVTTDAYDTTFNGGYDAFVAKFDYASAQVTIDYCTYLGGSGNDWGRGIHVDSSGYVYVGGRSISSNFPITSSYSNCNTSNYHAFATILDITAGTSGLSFSSCIGGSSTDTAFMAAWDASGNVVVSGITGSTNYPVSTSPFQSTKKGSWDVFISVLDY